MNVAERLIVFPGGSSPKIKKFVPDLYELIDREARKLGYGDVETLLLPGQADYDGRISGDLTLESSVEAAKTVIEKYERDGIQYDFLGRSYGTIVAAKLTLEMKPKHLHKLILWVIPPFWLNWKLCFSQFDTYSKILEQTGCRFTKGFFASTEPVESMLTDLVSYEKPDKIVVANGTLDELSPPSFNNYLRSLVGYTDKVEFRIVTGVGHSVTEANSSWPGYMRALFS